MGNPKKLIAGDVEITATLSSGRVESKFGHVVKVLRYVGEQDVAEHLKDPSSGFLDILVRKGYY